MRKKQSAVAGMLVRDSLCCGLFNCNPGRHDSKGNDWDIKDQHKQIIRNRSEKIIIHNTTVMPVFFIYLNNFYGAVTHLTDKGNGRLTDRKNAGDGSRLSGGEYRRESRKERMRTEQVTKKEQSTNVRVKDV